MVGDMAMTDVTAEYLRKMTASADQIRRQQQQQMSGALTLSPAFAEQLLKTLKITPEGAKVSTVDAQLKQKLQERRDEREVTARLALVDAYGEDVYPDGTVITFDKLHAEHGQVYSYAVLKAAGKWYTTGSYSHAAIHNWDTLVEFLVSGPKPVKTFIVKAEGGVEVPATATVNQS